MRGLGNKFLGHSKENNVCIKQAQDFDEYFMVVYRIVCDDYSVVLLLPLIDLNQFMFFFTMLVILNHHCDQSVLIQVAQCDFYLRS